MPSSYLATIDLATYGLPASTPQGAIVQASALVDDYLGRPEGLVWTPDATGAPAFMAGLQHTMTYTLTAPLATGVNVPAQISPPIATQDMVGDVLVLDRATAGAKSSILETCVVAAVSGPGLTGSITLTSVANAHAVGATLDQGLLITEERGLPNKRSVTRASRFPLIRILGLQGRYGYGRRSDQVGGLFQEMNLIAAAQSFGGPPLWVSIDPTQASVNPSTGEVWVPAGMLLAYYSDVRLRYVAGYAAASLPSFVKAATAQIVTNLAANAGYGPSVSRIKAGDTEIQRAIITSVDPDTRAMLAPLKARVFF